ncbi:hypothetical protein GDO81_022166 [Engystomops pustulosus]|uniref:Uncharacterized protein n=1 Tax=Engystomops pustulosus TaxID=76066 RepID=A0AAV6YU37_ENGPU|nr:hypothetical protein GDO81_022166 [Engystomops pustulosus]
MCPNVGSPLPGTESVLVLSAEQVTQCTCYPLRSMNVGGAPFIYCVNMKDLILQLYCSSYRTCDIRTRAPQVSHGNAAISVLFSMPHCNIA